MVGCVRGGKGTVIHDVMDIHDIGMEEWCDESWYNSERKVKLERELKSDRR